MTLVNRLLVLVGVVLALVAGGWIYQSALLHKATEQMRAGEMDRTLAFVSSEYDRFVDGAKNVVEAVSLQAPEAVAYPGRCQALVNWLHQSERDWLRVDVLDSDGIVRCSTQPSDIGRNMGAYVEVATARIKKRTVIGDYAWSFFSASHGLVLTSPWSGPHGVGGVVAAVAGVGPFVNALATWMPRGYMAVVADRGGRIIASEPAAAGLIGQELSPALARLARLPSSNRVVTQWTDGSERSIVYSPISAQRSNGVFIAIAVGPSLAGAGAFGFKLVSGIGLSVTAIVAFFLAWWGGIHFIRKPMLELAAVALRWRDGDQTARVALPGRSEVAALGRVFNAMADAKDESDRKLREGAELLTALIESSRDSIFVLERDGRLLVANSMFLELIGGSREEVVGFRLVVPDDLGVQQQLDRLRELIITSRMPQAADIVGRTANGRQHVLQAILAPIFGDAGEVRAVAGIGRDVTDVRAAAETLRVARDEAEATNRAKTRFLAAASHDLRQPLQAAILLSDLVAQKTRLGVDASTPAGNLWRALDEMRRLVDSLFDVSRLDSGAVHVDFTAFPLQELFDQITPTYAALATKKKIKISISKTEAVVRSDRVLLARMLSNLIENAIRYTEVGRVAVMCRVADGRLHVCVEDTGMGISRQDLSRIWLEFEQLHNAGRDRRQGLGLGLSIVQRISALLDHPVDVASELGHGSRFTVRIPLVEARSVVPAEVDEPHPNEFGAGRPVLLIDDDPLVLEVLQTILDEHGWRVIAVPDGANALQALADVGCVPALVIADYRLHGGQVGTEVITAVRHHIDSEVPAIILTGEFATTSDESDPLRRDARRVGASLLQKPIRSRDLLMAMSSAMTASPA
jgi:PAS domain S-box-containing protein